MDLIAFDGTEVFVVPNKICCISPYFYKKLFGKKKCGTAVLLDNGKFVLVQNDYAEVLSMLRYSGVIEIGENIYKELQRKYRSIVRALAIERAKNKKKGIAKDYGKNDGK